MRGLAKRLWFSRLLGRALGQPPARQAIGALHWACERLARRAFEAHCEPRAWSNRVLRQIAPLFDGRVANVSGWEDRDKRGGFYRDYFTRASGYELTNYRGERASPPPGIPCHFLDLSAPEAPPHLARRYQAVFNHSTLEHVLDVANAVRLLCALSDDSVLVVVPALAKLHAASAYGDFWRFTPDSLIELFRASGFEAVQIRSNDNPYFEVYLFGWFSRRPQRWSGYRRLEPAAGHARWGGREDYEPFFHQRYGDGR